MTSRTLVHRLEVASNLYHFIEDQVLPGTGVSSDSFWKGFDGIVADLAPKNQALLASGTAFSLKWMPGTKPTPAPSRT